MTTSPSNILTFLHTIENLKRTKRTGWLYNSIQAPESIADHMHRMGVMAMLIDDPKLDRNKCIKMAIVHDLAESVIGDITPRENVSKEEKFRLEKDTMTYFQTLLGNTPHAREMHDLWQEYEDAVTPEAVLVKDLDKFEMIVQAFEYEKSNEKNLEEFFNSTHGKFKHPIIKSWVEDLYKERHEHMANTTKIVEE